MHSSPAQQHQSPLRLSLILGIAGLFFLSAGAAFAKEMPKLVLQITVDALRGDLPDRYSHVLG